MTVLPIREDEWLAEWERLQVGAAADERARTRAELQEAWNCSEKMARDRIRALMAAGRVVATRKRVARMDGLLTVLSAYTLKEEK